MNSDTVKDLLQEKLVDCQIEVEINGSHYNVTVVGDIFEGKRPVQRQQLVYSALQEQIAAEVYPCRQYEDLHLSRVAATSLNRKKCFCTNQSCKNQI